MRRFFVDKIEGKPVLTGDDHKHLAFVLRAKQGESVVLCPQDGYDYEAVIENISKDCTQLCVKEKRKNELEPELKLDLFVSLLKGDKLDYVIQKGTELGLSRFLPLKTQFVQVKAESVKTERLKKIAVEAAKQCGRGVVPEISEVVPFAQMLSKLSDYDFVIFPYENAKERDLKSVLSECKGNRGAVIIGSEGGFSPEEAAAIAKKGVTPVTLGKRILRAETACVTVPAVIMYQMGQWR